MKSALKFVLCLSAAAFVITVPTFAGVRLIAGVAPVPEPATMLVLGIGIGAVVVVRRFTKKS